MQAVLMTSLGGDKKLQYTSITTPKPQKDEVLLKVLYCGINHLDMLIREGKRPGPKIFPHILGSEIVGQLENREMVAVYPWIFCGVCKQCKSSNEQICDTGGTLGRTRWGGYAEYVVVPKENVISIARQVDLSAVCAVILAGTTAVHLVRRATIQNGSTVLITGATGGVGVLVMQLLKHKKCTIIATTSHSNKAQLLLGLGADHTVLVENMIDETKAIFPNGVEYVIDLVGGDTWSKALQTIAKNGTMVFCSTSKEEMGTVNIGNAFAKQLTILGSYGGNREDMQKALGLFEKGVLKPVIDSIYALQDAEKTHTKMENQESFGKMLLEI